jgi:hypothetical protein
MRFCFCTGYFSLKKTSYCANCINACAALFLMGKSYQKYKDYFMDFNDNIRWIYYIFILFREVIMQIKNEQIEATQCFFTDCLSYNDTSFFFHY